MICVQGSLQVPLLLQQAPQLEAVAPEQFLLHPGHRALIPGAWIPEAKADWWLLPPFKDNSIFTFTSGYRQDSWCNVSKVRSHCCIGCCSWKAPQPPLPKPTHGMCPPPQKLGTKAASLCAAAGMWAEWVWDLLLALLPRNRQQVCTALGTTRKPL